MYMQMHYNAHVTPAHVVSQGLLYAEVSLNTEGGGFGMVADRVEYATLDLNVMASQQPPPPQTPPPTHDLGQKQLIV